MKHGSEFGKMSLIGCKKQQISDFGVFMSDIFSRKPDLFPH